VEFKTTNASPFPEETPGLCLPGILKYHILNGATDAGNRVQAYLWACAMTLIAQPNLLKITVLLTFIDRVQT
jgi:hypothetical protein